MGSKCDSEDALPVIKSVALSEDPELLFVLVLDLPQWIRHLCDLVRIPNNFDCLVVFVNELTYRRVLSSVIIQRAEKRGVGGHLYKLHLADIYRGRVVKDLQRFKGVGTPFTGASRKRSFRFGRVCIAWDGGHTQRQIRANGVHINVAFSAQRIRFTILGNSLSTVPDLDT